MVDSQNEAFAKSKRKAVDSRIPQLIQNGVNLAHRSLFVMVGTPKEQHRQIVNLHYLLTQARLSATNPKLREGRAASRPTVLWTYKKELHFTSNRKKREAKVQRDVKRGIREEGDMDPFELFVGVTQIRYSYYKDAGKIVGQSFGMLVLQDFEAITPNLLAQTIETVEGGGIIVFLLQGMTSLRQLYTISMDVHARYRTESSGAPTARFNERFILSLGPCPMCLVLDDELNVLPVSKAKDVTSIDPIKSDTSDLAKLEEMKMSLREANPVGPIIAEARTVDQAKAILTFTDAIASKLLAQTVALTAARGRGKSAALGLSISLAIAHSYSNIFVTSPSPENLKTLFQFIFKGLDKLGYQEHLDYDVLQSTNQDWKDSIVRVNIFRDHRQTIQYIQPQDAHVLGQAELLVIDEAAAIPLTSIRKLLGPFLVFMASTINGYEGTGRSLSLKLLQQLRESTAPRASQIGAQGSGRQLREIQLETPIRYGCGDVVENWLNSLLCLDAASSPNRTTQGSPLPADCDLYAVDRDTLFSFHPASEVFLHRMMSLYVSSHYKNSPNDLQLMSDAPQHRLFVLLPPLRQNLNGTVLPDPLAVVQVALEGRISRQSILTSLTRGLRAGGDLIPWTISQQVCARTVLGPFGKELTVTQYQDEEFASLSGVRIVRIAVHPDYAQMGYGSRALQALDTYYSGHYLSLEEAPKARDRSTFEHSNQTFWSTAHQDDQLSVRDPSRMAPLLHRLSDLPPEQIDWLGASFGLTGQLFRFWKRAGYSPLYLRQTQNDITGEHSCVVIRGLSGTPLRAQSWLSDFSQDFRKRFLTLLSFAFRETPSTTVLSILEAISSIEKDACWIALTAGEVSTMFTPFDLKRLSSYANNLLDYHAVIDLLPSLGLLYFSGRFGSDLRLSALQQAMLVTLGMQRRPIEAIEKEHGVPVPQALALFTKAIRKLNKSLEQLTAQEVMPSIAREPTSFGSELDNSDALHDEAQVFEAGTGESSHKANLSSTMDVQHASPTRQVRDADTGARYDAQRAEMGHQHLTAAVIQGAKKRKSSLSNGKKRKDRSRDRQHR